nr:hypothetical protein [Tanacetum cinerariifolium]
MSSDRSSSFMSSYTLSSHLSIGLLLLFRPSTTKASTLLTGADCGLLMTCPNHLNRPSLILLKIVSKLRSIHYVDPVERSGGMVAMLVGRKSAVTGILSGGDAGSGEEYTAMRPNYDLINHCIDHGPYEFKMVDHPAKEATENSKAQLERRGLETYSFMSEEKQKLIDAEAEEVHIILSRIDNDIYSKLDSCANVFENVIRFLLVGLYIFLKVVEIKAMSFAISSSLGISYSSLTTLCSDSKGEEGALTISFPLMVDHPAKEATENSKAQLERRGLETYSFMSEEKQKLIDAEAEAVHIILSRIDNDIYSKLDSCANVKEM